MKKVKGLVRLLVCSLLLTVGILFFGHDIAEASEVPLPKEYFFVIDGVNRPTGYEYEMSSRELIISVSAQGGWDVGTTVTWMNSNNNVVTLHNQTTTTVQLRRVGPGYTTITALIQYGSLRYTLSCQILVNLSFDETAMNLIYATTTRERVLVLSDAVPEKEIVLKYVDTSVVSGSAISESVEFTSENVGVAEVIDGKIYARGGGSTRITATTTTRSTKGTPKTDVIRVVVKPTFKLSYDVGNTHVEKNSTDDPSTATPALNVPSSFVINSNALHATNLVWRVKDVSTGKFLPSESAKMAYSVSDLSGNVTFERVKAGTYEIFAYTHNDYVGNSAVPYAYMKIVVPITIRDLNLIMQVGDKYDIVENSNIPEAKMFTYTYVENEDSLITQVDGNGLITALRKGHAQIRVRYLSTFDLFDDSLLGTQVPYEFIIDINVIDGIALNMTSASLYTSGTLLLQALMTDPSAEITWTSSNPSIATVDGGLVKALKPGNTIITVSQKIGGVIKSATCSIVVTQSVTSITIDPAEVVLPIGHSRTLKATVKPNNLSGVNLTWKSSNENIVTISDATPLTVTITGVAGGHAVVSAINQDNVVVGYCHVSVKQSVTSIVLSETNVVVDLNTKKMQLRASVYPENALNKEVYWTSTDETKAKVDANGMVTFLKPGTVSIIATSSDSPAVRAICNITIQIPVSGVSLDEKTKTMYVGEVARLSYVISPSTASTNTVTWTSSNSSVVSVDATGKVTAKGAGTAVIILRSLDGGHTAYCTITVKRIATGVKLDVAKLDLKVGEYYYLNAELTPKDSTDTKLVWESSDTKVATVDANGKVIAKDSGQTIIMVRTETGAYATCKVTVTQPVKGLIMNFTEKTVYTGEEFKLKVSVSPSSATETRVVWKSSNTDVATVNEDGVVTAISGGTALITCTTVEGGYNATCVVTVLELVTTIKLNHESYRLGVDKSVVLEATVSNQTASNKKVTWKSSNPKVATVNSKGKVTGVAFGDAVITAIAQDGSGAEASCEIEVVRPVTKVSLDKSYLNMLVGESKGLTASMEPKNATYKDVAWVSSDDSIAIVDDDGVVTAIAPGTVSITAQAQDDSGKKAVCFVTVSNRVPSTGITLENRSLVMVAGEVKLVQYAKSPANSTDNISWSSDNTGVATVDKKTGKITAKAVGTANITAMTDSGKTALIEVKVIGLNVTKLELEQYSRYTLTVEGASGRITWDVRNPEVAEVTNGRIITKAIGSTVITAQVNGRILECKLKVVKIGKLSK